VVYRKVVGWCWNLENWKKSPKYHKSVIMGGPGRGIIRRWRENIEEILDAGIGRRIISGRGRLLREVIQVSPVDTWRAITSLSV